MPKFATIKVDEIKAKEVVEQLLIDGLRVMEIYEQSLAGTTYQSEFITLFRYIEYAADGNGLPKTKMRKYRGNQDGVSEYEFKSKHLRVWAIQQPSKKIIILGGFKNSQRQDEIKFRFLKQQFLQFLNNSK